MSADLIILRAPMGSTDLNHGGDWYTPNPQDRLFAVTPDRVPHFLGPGGCVVVDPDEARRIVLARQARELVALGLA